MNDSCRPPWCSHRRAADRAMSSAVAARSERDFTALYHEYRFIVEAQVSVWIPAAERPDVCQEVWMDVWRSAHTYKGDAPLGAWLRVITRRRILGWARTHRRKSARLQNWDLTTSAAPPKDLDLAIDLHRALTSLPKRRAHVMALYVAGYLHHEIAALLGIDEGTSKSQKARGAAGIRKMLQECGQSHSC